MNAEGDHTMSQTGTYSCTCSGEGCDVIAVPKKGGDWDVACSSCTSDCTGRWVDSDVGVNSGFINIDKGITFIQESVECGDSPDPSSFFEIPELHQKINDFATNHKLSLWDGDSDDFVLIPLQAFGTPLMLKFDSNLPPNVLAEVADNNIVILTDKGDGTPSCNCGSGSSGCNFEPIEYDAGWLGKRTVGYRCAAGECETCNMTLPESN